MRREQLLPLIGKHKVSVRYGPDVSLVDYHVIDVGEVFLHGNGPGQGHTPIRLAGIRTVAWTEETRHIIRRDEK